MAIRLIVEVNDMGLWIHVFFVCDEGLDRGEVRESFHTEFGVKASTEGIKDLIFLLSAVPDIPLMHVTNRRIGGDFAISPRRARMIWDCRSFGSCDIGKDSFIDIACRKVRLQPVLLVLIGVVVSQTHGFLDLIVLVIASKDDKRRMMADTANIGHRLSFDGGNNLVKNWIVAASEHEVLPNHDTEFITSVVKCIILVDTTTPYTERVSGSYYIFEGMTTAYRIIFWLAGTISSIHALYFSGVILGSMLSVGIQHEPPQKISTPFTRK